MICVCFWCIFNRKRLNVCQNYTGHQWRLDHVYLPSTVLSTHKNLLQSQSSCLPSRHSRSRPPSHHPSRSCQHSAPKVEAGIILWIKWEKKWVQDTQMGVSENSVPLNPMVLLIIIPIKLLFHWEYTQHFQTNPNGNRIFWIILPPARSCGDYPRFLAPLVAAHVLSNMGLLQTISNCYTTPFCSKCETLGPSDFWHLFDVNAQSESASLSHSQWCLNDSTRPQWPSIMACWWNIGSSLFTPLVGWHPKLSPLTPIFVGLWCLYDVYAAIFMRSSCSLQPNNHTAKQSHSSRHDGSGATSSSAGEGCCSAVLHLYVGLSENRLNT